MSLSNAIWTMDLIDSLAPSVYISHRRMNEKPNWWNRDSSFQFNLYNSNSENDQIYMHEKKNNNNNFGTEL